MQSGKAERFLELIDDIHANHEKVPVFTQFCALEGLAIFFTIAHPMAGDATLYLLQKRKAPCSEFGTARSGYRLPLENLVPYTEKP